MPSCDFGDYGSKSLAVDMVGSQVLLGTPSSSFRERRRYTIVEPHAIAITEEWDRQISEGNLVSMAWGQVNPFSNVMSNEPPRV